MTKLRVYIATTEGPSEIQGIIEEDGDLQSVICLDGTASALPVSTGYDAFVRKPTGVIERVTGNRVYRMDVSHPITNGDSWQLGVYLAHMLAHSNILADRNELSSGVVLATGALRTRDLHVDQVGHVVEKLESAASLLENNMVTFILPADDYEALPKNLLNRYKDKVNFLSLEDAVDIVAKLSGEVGIEQKPVKPFEEPSITPAALNNPMHATDNGKKGIIALIILGVIIVGVGGHMFSQWQLGMGLQKELARMTRGGHFADLLEFKDNTAFDGAAGKIANYFFPISQASDELSFKISQIRPSDGKSCAGMRYRNATYNTQTLEPKITDSNIYELENARALCAFEISVHNIGPRDLEILSLVKPNMLMGRFLSSREGGEVESFKLPANASRSIEIKLPLYRNNRIDYDIWLIGAPQQSRQLYDMLKAEARADNSLSFNWADLRDVGINIIEARMEIGG